MGRTKKPDKSMPNESVNQVGSLTLPVDALTGKASTAYLHELGERMKIAREALGLSQARFGEEYGHNVRTYQKNEGGVSEAGMCLAASFVLAGINANWLLTGEGPMLLAELNTPKVVEIPAPINKGALAALVKGALEHYGRDAPIEKVASAAADFYDKLISDGQITPTGIGEGKKAAA